MIEFNIFYKLAAALGIGFIIGMQRENSYSRNNSRHPAGLCSFSIVSLCGALSCYLGELMESIVPFVTGLVVVGLLLVASHVAYGLSNRGNGGPAGVTTSAALIMIYFLGALCWFNRLLEACILMIILLWLLAVKRQLHEFAKKLSSEDIMATVKFAVISLLILPFLPNHAFGPPGLEVLNPHTIWLFVVFISGIGFVGYVLIKVVGPGKGIWLTGLLGGLASSTALTLNLVGRSRDNEQYAADFTLGIVLSWSVMYVRLYLICVFLVPSLALPLLAPLLVPVVPGLGYALYLKIRESKNHLQKTTDFNNPFKLLPAIKFGLVFTVVMFLANAARVYLGSGALIACSFLGGAAEMDAVAFSLIDMCRKATLENHSLILALLFASLANTITKGGIVYFLGAKAMRRPIIPAVVLICGVTVAMIGVYSVV
ncbi:MAG: MgtC/SapB family protein [Fibrobacter sp.]|uniref:MgtC/SapB family protein n=1 Tax=Fibrobacter sp. TaxID=35828 RepID=UPI0025BDA4CF|nr:MgtC/SapB family protein [Fibrobacter sp.]MBQ7078860.1 MgtC/SapB family protein [Fibrobacter sp.]